MKTSAQPDTRFLSEAGKYAAYLETPEGRLRLDLAFANLSEFLPEPHDSDSIRALDLGCGTGATAVSLAKLGLHNVTLLDYSPAMLDIAQRTARDADIIDRVAFKPGDVMGLSRLFKARSFDVIVCHNLLEYMDDPVAVLCGAAGLLRDSSSVLSLLVRSQAGEVLKAAIQTGDLSAANDALSSEWGKESLYGGKVRLFALDRIRDLMKAASLGIIAERGVRIVADYLPLKVSRSEEYDRILELERKLGTRAEFVAVARYVQVLARLVTH
jgi:S-adenosylmethionine-dependent methyltransferase